MLVPNAMHHLLLPECEEHVASCNSLPSSHVSESRREGSDVHETSSVARNASRESVASQALLGISEREMWSRGVQTRLSLSSASGPLGKLAVLIKLFIVCSLVVRTIQRRFLLAS